MHRLLKKVMFNLILIAMLIPGTSMYVEMVGYDGLIEPYVVVDIGASTEGIVDRITVERSSLVKKGQTLVKMESTVERAVLAKAMATFGAEIGLQNTQPAFAKRTTDRFQRLDAIANFDKDQAATEILRVKYRLEQARERKTLARYELPNADQQMPSGLRCLVRFEIGQDYAQTAKVTAQVESGLTQD
ncbi:MAG: hypothetical protein GY850_15120 [bacterium]|nr:hypothetical protein [bacterium]